LAPIHYGTPAMAETTQQRSQQKRRVALVALLVLMGSCGVGNGVSGLRAGPPPDVEAEGANMGQATLELAETMGQTLHAAPMRRALAAGNLLVSLLLPIAAATVLTRRSSMRWWVTQAALANVVWTGLDVASQVSALLGARAELLPAIEREVAERQAAEPALAEAAVSAQSILYGLATMLVLFGGLRVLIYAVVMWLARRVDREQPFT
jgi:hypothetical protein